MTRNSHGEIIGRAGARDCSYRIRRADAVGDHRIRDPLTDWYLLQCLPDSTLERCTPYIKWQIQPDVGIFDEPDNASDQRLVLAIGAD